MEEQQRDTQEHNVKLFTQLQMERDAEFSKENREEQARKRERSKEARSKRMDLGKKAKSMEYLRHTRCDQSIAELLPGSRPGSSRDGQLPPPRDKSLHDREVDRIEELLDEVELIKES